MRALVAAMLVVAVAVCSALAGGCTQPSYGNGHLQCGPASACPSGFYCASDQHCWSKGSGPGGELGVGGNDDLGSLDGDLGAAVDLAPNPSTCASLSGVLFCDGFEKSLIASGWSASGSNGMPSIDTSRAYRGASSLHSHINGAPIMAAPVALLHRSDLFPILGTMYARIWVYFTSGLPPSFEQFLNFADNASTGYSVATDLGKIALNDYITSGPYQRSVTAMPLDRWACIQFEVQQGSAAGTIRILLDGQLLADLPQTAVTTPAANLSVGLDFYGNSAAIPQYDAWFDELIIDNKPTTCGE
jgi:hypothetical protein